MMTKKNRGNEICFIILEEIGKSKIIYKNINDVDYKLRVIINSLFRKIK